MSATWPFFRRHRPPRKSISSSQTLATYRVAFEGHKVFKSTFMVSNFYLGGDRKSWRLDKTFFHPILKVLFMVKFLDAFFIILFNIFFFFFFLFLPDPQFWNMRPNFSRTGGLRWLRRKVGKAFGASKVELKRAQILESPSSVVLERAHYFKLGLLVQGPSRVGLKNSWLSGSDSLSSHHKKINLPVSDLTELVRKSGPAFGFMLCRPSIDPGIGPF